MKYPLLFLMGLCLALGLSCSENGTSPADFFTVSGVVKQNGNPVTAVEVSIDRSADLKTTSDANGAFAITNVPGGQHTLTLFKTSAQDSGKTDSSFVERSYDISVLADLVVQNLRLPNPVLLHPVEFTANGTKLSWSPSNAEDFREYKLYRHTSSGLDESTGTLIHVTTSRSDTTFLDQTSLSPGDYFYRIFVMNELGRLGGSNIEMMTVDVTKLIISIKYEGQGTVSSVNRLFVGVFDQPNNPDFQDEGSLGTNNTSIELTIEDSPLQNVKADDNTFGPYYVGSFLDVSGIHQGSSTLPSGAPAIIYDGINPFDSTGAVLPTPIMVTRGAATEIIVRYGDAFRAP